MTTPVQGIDSATNITRYTFYFLPNYLRPTQERISTCLTRWNGTVAKYHSYIFCGSTLAGAGLSVGGVFSDQLTLAAVGLCIFSASGIAIGCTVCNRCNPTSDLPV